MHVQHQNINALTLKKATQESPRPGGAVFHHFLTPKSDARAVFDDELRRIASAIRKIEVIRIYDVNSWDSLRN